MSWVTSGTAAVGLAPSIFKFISGNKQANAAKKINPINPGFQMNSGIIDNARVLGERAGNYSMPGYSSAVNNIGASTANAFSQGMQGASSGGDVLDLATKLAYGQQQQLNGLATQNAQGADNALLQSLNATAQAGDQYQQKNAYDRDMYQQQLREKAALIQAGNTNMYGALDSAATVGTSLINPRKSISDTSTDGFLNPTQLREYNLWKARQGLMTQDLGSPTGLIS